MRKNPEIQGQFTSIRGDIASFFPARSFILFSFSIVTKNQFLLIIHAFVNWEYPLFLICFSKWLQKSSKCLPLLPYQTQPQTTHFPSCSPLQILLSWVHQKSSVYDAHSITKSIWCYYRSQWKYPPWSRGVVQSEVRVGATWQGPDRAQGSQRWWPYKSIIGYKPQ